MGERKPDAEVSTPASSSGWVTRPTMARGQVLVVDDEPSILSTLKKALSLEGYAVDVAGGIGVAEERLAKKTFDMVLWTWRCRTVTESGCCSDCAKPEPSRP